MKDVVGLVPWIFTLCALFIYGAALHFKTQPRHKAAKLFHTQIRDRSRLIKFFSKRCWTGLFISGPAAFHTAGNFGRKNMTSCIR